MSQQQVQLQGHHVTQYMANMQQRDENMLQNYQVCKDNLLDAANLYAEAKDEGKLQALRGQLLELVAAEQQLRTHRAALSTLACSYQPSLDKTDFKAALHAAMQAAQAGQTFHAERDEAVTDFDEIAGTSGGGGAGGGGAAGGDADGDGLDSDEDLQVVGNVAKNERCPYTRKELADLDEPLEDQLGFVYEGSAIRAALAAAQRDRTNWIECPLPGVSHRIMLHQLKPASKRRLQRLARARAAHAGGTQGGGAGGRGVVLDV